MLQKMDSDPEAKVRSAPTPRCLEQGMLVESMCGSSPFASLGPSGSSLLCRLPASSHGLRFIGPAGSRAQLRSLLAGATWPLPCLAHRKPRPREGRLEVGEPGPLVGWDPQPLS